MCVCVRERGRVGIRLITHLMPLITSLATPPPPPPPLCASPHLLYHLPCLFALMSHASCLTTPHVPLPFSLPHMCTADACVDTDNEATDLSGDGCSGYSTSPSWCGLYDDDDFSSMDMCCACAAIEPGEAGSAAHICIRVLLPHSPLHPPHAPLLYHRNSP